MAKKTESSADVQRVVDQMVAASEEFAHNIAAIVGAIEEKIDKTKASANDARIGTLRDAVIELDRKVDGSMQDMIGMIRTSELAVKTHADQAASFSLQAQQSLEKAQGAATARAEVQQMVLQCKEILHKVQNMHAAGSPIESRVLELERRMNAVAPAEVVGA